MPKPSTFPALLLTAVALTLAPSETGEVVAMAKAYDAYRNYQVIDIFLTDESDDADGGAIYEISRVEIRIPHINWVMRGRARASAAPLGFHAAGLEFNRGDTRLLTTRRDRHGKSNDIWEHEFRSDGKSEDEKWHRLTWEERAGHAGYHPHIPGTIVFARLAAGLPGFDPILAIRGPSVFPDSRYLAKGARFTFLTPMEKGSVRDIRFAGGTLFRSSNARDGVFNVFARLPGDTLAYRATQAQGQAVEPLARDGQLYYQGRDILQGSSMSWTRISLELPCRFRKYAGTALFSGPGRIYEDLEQGESSLLLDFGVRLPATMLLYHAYPLAAYFQAFHPCNRLKAIGGTKRITAACPAPKGPTWATRCTGNISRPIWTRMGNSGKTT